MSSANFGFLQSIFSSTLVSDLSALLHWDTTTLSVGHLPTLFIRDLPAVRLGHVATVVDGDGLTVVPELGGLPLAVGGEQDVSSVGWLASLHIFCNETISVRVDHVAIQLRRNQTSLKTTSSRRFYH